LKTGLFRRSLGKLNEKIEAFGVDRQNTLEYPLLSDLFSIDKLERHGESMARVHVIDYRIGNDKLLGRLAENEKTLKDIFTYLTHEEASKQSLQSAGIWLLDNFYLICEQIQTARNHFPERYSRILPRLGSGSSAGLPRVYDIAQELISHVDGRIDEGNLRSIVAGYQKVTSLNLGELWAIPIMLRLALIENLRHISTRIIGSWTESKYASFWADRMLATAGNDPQNIVLDMAEMVRADIPLTCAFVSEYNRRLQSQNNILNLPLTWLEQRLAQQGTTIEARVQTESGNRAGNQISMSNSISSLRILMTIDWKNFVESNSSVDKALGKDPSGDYSKMDFATRDRYRHVIEKLARQSGLSEENVASQAVDFARSTGHDDRKKHVGYYLIDRGRTVFEKSLRIHLSLRDAINKFGRKAPVSFYLTAIFILTCGLSSVVLYLARPPDSALFIIESVVLLVCFSQLAVALVNRAITLMIPPVPPPRMDFNDGIPAGMKTLITVPAMLSDEDEIKRLLNKMEVCFLSNNDRNICFSLLTDFLDAPEEHTDDDVDLLSSVRNGIRDLNARYGTDGVGPFLLFHRPRRWNRHERTWMGYERKRGKLEALNNALRFHVPGELLVEGDPVVLAGIRYVITLDTDTQLPRDAARHLVETMAHPLNRPVYDPIRRIVTEGYTILQPRVVSNLPLKETSRYARMFGSDSGIDPYTRAVSDVYQDLKGEGSFIGKGIYDVDMFIRVLEGRFPDNRILSHDLLEGTFCRSGLVSDIQLIDKFPEHYRDDIERRHRWIRGDWQIASWILPRIPGPGRRFEKNRLSLLSRWKILDNLRRSAVSFAMMFLIVPSFFLVSPSWAGLLTATVILFAPVLLETFLLLMNKPEKHLFLVHLRTVTEAAMRHTARTCVDFAFIPHDAYVNADAVLRTLWRLFVSRRRLLEWKSHHETISRTRINLPAYVRFMLIVPISMSALIHALLLYGKEVGVAYPIIAMWFFSPILAWWISRPLKHRREVLSATQRKFLRKICRKTWRYFETFSGVDNNWLPADNYQEAPVEATAHRTSPTNIGLMLLSNLGAYDRGYLPAGQLIGYTIKSFGTLEGMERFRGHFFNWYDTSTLRPLAPGYISTVDSGNMSGYILTLRRGLLDLKDNMIFSNIFFRGLSDTVQVLAEHIVPPSDILTSIFIQKTTIEERFGTLSKAVSHFRRTSVSLSDILNNIQSLIGQIKDIRAIVDAGENSETVWWCDAFEKQCIEHREELLYLAPWLAIPGFKEMVASKYPILDVNMTLSQLAELGASISLVDEDINGENGVPPCDICNPEDITKNISYLVSQGIIIAQERIARIERLSSECQNLADADYDFLYDNSRRLLSIGYDTTHHRRDDGYYDLLASEARLGSFIGISQGKLPLGHWFALGRQVTVWKGEIMLLSWGGSMFEYLMPQLVMPSYDNTLLDTTCRAVVARQIEYGRLHGDFWGISESAENMTDAGFNYQYRSFGVPDLGFKRGLAQDMVIAPYASVLAIAYSPREACVNLQKMSERGFEGRYGFYEAIDYTPSRRAHDGSEALIRSFMSHHQGMSFISLVNFFTNNIMARRFVSDPLFHTTSLLLQEKVPRVAPFNLPPSDIYTSREASAIQEDLLRSFSSPQTVFPEVHLLSNGRYHVMVTNAGGGYSKWHDIFVTRWRSDPTRDNSGSFIYINDVSNDDIWSSSYQPTLIEPKSYEAVFLQARAEFKRRDQGLDSITEIAVSPEEDVEYRRITVTNVGLRTKTIELTSYAEVVLLPPAADEQHPAFSNLFVQTEIIRNQRAIVCTRRSRTPHEKNPWMFHLLSLERDGIIPDVSFETDRMKFIGRGRTTVNPIAVEKGGRLSGSEGFVLDTIASIRCILILKPGETATVGFVTGIAETRSESLALIEKYQDRRLADRVFELAMIHDRVTLQQLNVTETDAQVYGKLAGSILYTNNSRRANPAVLMKNNRGQSGLWAYSISGDIPIVLLRISDQSKIDIAVKCIQAHAYWRRRGLKVDLVIWNEDFSGYRQNLGDLIMGLISSEPDSSSYDRLGGIFLKYPDQMTEEDRILMLSAACVIITDGGGTLAEQIRLTARGDILPYRRITRREESDSETEHFKQSQLLFFNGYGGFTEDGREYIIQIKHGTQTPLPWVNVIANRRIGTVVSQGGAYTWYENAHEFRITPWHNDPVCDTSGEVLYLKDQASGKFWSPTPLPSPGTGDYLNRHGFGYSVFEYIYREIKSELWIYVDPDDPVKFWLLKVRNDSSSRRSLSASAFLELVLGDNRTKTHMHVRTEIDTATGALFATNSYNVDFAERVVFLESSEYDRSISGDRTEFIGRNGNLSDPAAMYRKRLSGKVGDGLDPAAAMQVYFDLEPGQEKEIVFIFGAGKNYDEARNLVLRYRTSLAAYQSRDRVWDYWKHTLGAVSIETPDTALNLISNGWLIYQVISSRLWARSGFYQSGGAFGFRDQLQDVAALIYSKPEMAREQILLCASKQFPEGDVQHWWHPPQGRGVRTRISDDYLWLPCIACLYVKRTGDTGVLDELVHFISGRLLGSGEESYYDMPRQSDEKVSVYEHCVRAIRHAFHFGEHGLPLMGSGDWNDGMNFVGIEGKGESVWLGFFLFKILNEFHDIALAHGDASFAEECAATAMILKENIDSSAWDGQWFLRGFFDDGTPLGSSQNQECRIDSIAQSWAILSGASTADRSSAALRSLEHKLVSQDTGLIRLLDPPFNIAQMEPGYIKGYPPGIRENGGQYTHAAVWAVMAFAQQGHTEKMKDLLFMLNPVNHGSSREKIERYGVEPYVMAADVYSVEPYVGRGGWTWYTGSASWMYRLVIESIFGINVQSNRLAFSPCMPSDWEITTMHYRYRETVYHLVFRQHVPGGTVKIELDGADQADNSIILVDDRRDHNVMIDIG
jgi:cyclic beta-1,2-glucan synthetase